MPRRNGGTSVNPVRHRTVSTKPIVRRRPGMAIPRKKAKTRRDVNKKLTTLRTAVQRLQMKTYGEVQLQAQAFYHRGDGIHSPDTPHVYDLCAEQPLMFCPQAIRNFAAVWQLRYNPAALPGARFNELQIGGFDPQKFAFAQLNADPTSQNDERYNTLQYWKNSQGVQPKYLLKNSAYEFEVSAAGVSGYVEICAVSNRRNFIRSATSQFYALPSGLRSYINTCKGSLDCNVISQQVTKVRVLKRMYFQYYGVRNNDDPPIVSGANKYFGPRSQVVRIKMKHNNVIAVAVLEPTIGSGDAGGNPNQVIDYTEIPVEQQTWIMVRTSVPQSALTPLTGAPTPGADPFFRLDLQMRRVVCWRDWLGNSLA